ncbi:hypothetical protein MVEN_02218400 [Mycena venus]|uniref:Uncharacterized protein n=1 Tax=Mycena venus TaxID=2733690 RepID=A0A8H7CFP9_9AGAR|nr:hypothetical protein MVEN_02218400 [Mycena venus]
MNPTSTLIGFILFAVATALQNVPGCLPDEQATVVTQSIFSVPDPTAPPGPGLFTNLTLTYFTCPSRQAPAQSNQPPIQICGAMDGSEVFFTATFSCDQAPGNEPKLGDCANINTAVVDSIIRPMTITIPARSGIIMSLFNNTCTYVLLNDDANDTYQTCLNSIPDVGFDITEECPQQQDGFIGSVRSAIQPGGAELGIAHCSVGFFGPLDEKLGWVEIIAELVVQ